jgi:hypothetical protein
MSKKMFGILESERSPTLLLAGINSATGVGTKINAQNFTVQKMLNVV